MPTDDYHLPPDALPPLPEIPDSRTALSAVPLGRFRPENRAAFRYCSVRSMDSTDSERPVSYSSTSSSASSRDSRCSLGSRTMLVSNNHLGMGSSPQDRDTGAIRLELVPARQLGCREEQGHQADREKRAESKGAGKHSAQQIPAVEEAGPKLLYVDRVVQEILDTERTYVQDLKSIVQDYLDCISNQSRLTLEVEERASLFGNIRDIYHFNSELLQDLENCNADPVAIAECFVAKSEEFHIYTQYCTNYPRSVAVLTECMRNKVLAKFFRERQESLQHSLPLGSYLLKPVQRILKYHLLLHEIANHLDKDTEAYEVVLDAIDTMQRVAWHINDMKRKHEHAVRLQEIQSLLTNWKGPDLISYGELVLEGTFRIQRAKNERTLFLFDKLLLVTKKREESYTYKAHILCCNLMLVEVIPKEPLSFSVFHYKNPKLQHTVQAKSQQDKRLWILHLKRLILENHPAKIPAKAKQAILEMDAVHHPGFHYSPEGEKKTVSHSKESTTPRRVRRKSEPSARLLRSSKQNEMNPDVQKRISMEGSLLSQAAQIGSIEGLRSPNGRAKALGHRDLGSQSQESLDPTDPSDAEESLHLQAGEQADADDEDEIELGIGLNFKVLTKGARKRLNSQASENVEKRRSLNVSSQDSEAAKERLPNDASHLGLHKLTRQTARQPDVSRNSDLNTLLGGDHNLRNIWTDHQIRQALFPSRQPTLQAEEEEDIYQMFVPTVSAPNERVSRIKEGFRGSGRPCSWHVEQLQQESPKARAKVIRRASSVGEKNSGYKAPISRDINKIIDQSNSLQIETSSNISGSDSAEQLTIDDIENVYDNISYEDLKSMGLIRRDHECSHSSQGTAEERTNLSMQTKVRLTSHTVTEGNDLSHQTADTKSSYSQDAVSFGTCELKIVEENIYDTIGFSENSEHCKSDREAGKRDTLPAFETDFGGCDSLCRFISEESLPFSEEDASDHRIPVEPDYSGWVDSSSNSDSFSHRSTADKMSEQVDEIWNDLENYIKKNEKKQDRLPAAFPVNRQVVREKVPVESFPELQRAEASDETEKSSSFSIPETPSTVKTVRSKLARLSSGSFRSEEGDSHRDRSVLSLSRNFFSCEVDTLDNSQASANSILSNSSSETAEFPGDIVDKTKNRVFLMARQYSQKIKKANQLLKMRSPEQDHATSRQRSKTKDLAAILEEKKQGGAAIGARIAEYSQLYEQIMFRETPPSTQKTPQSPADESLGEQHSPSKQTPSQRSCQSDSDRHCLSEDWLNSTYSNGELADFVSWPDKADLKGEDRTAAAQWKLTPACSVPALKTVPPTHTPTQRWSAFVSQPNKENFNQEHIYNSLGRRPSSAKPLPYNRCQSSSSVMMNNKSAESTGSQYMRERKLVSSGRNSVAEMNYGGPGSCHNNEHAVPPPGQQQSVPEQKAESLSDMILQDSQQVLVVNRNSLMNAHIATQNYFANFKDTGEDDDEDYVEIKSDDEEQDSDQNPQRAGFTPCVKDHCNRGLTQSLSMPCSPVKSCHRNLSPVVSLANFTDQDKLNDYLWSVPSANQQNIVQSLREKFQCLSSSSFA
ncbi:pleckstrin homology domain-containing family G member 1 isoform X2 [Amia ocellicauda]|uniref:pleckstrin homology domain-containing family G member 1 isoform X2 n=1 Tax=Amia ocellicauda TaxID=2972642 RepID=UPI003464B0C1